jgi:hypothetical protein
MLSYCSPRQHANPKGIRPRRFRHLIVAFINEPPRAGQFAGNDGEEQVKSPAFFSAPMVHSTADGEAPFRGFYGVVERSGR